MDAAAVERELPILRTLLSAFNPRDQFNCDEFGFMYKMAPRTTIGPRRLPGKKFKKERITFMACTNADGSERLPPLVIGHAVKPRCFDGFEPWKYEFDYHGTKKAWNNKLVFFEWLSRFDKYIGLTPGRRAALLLDNCSAHGNITTLPPLSDVYVIFLPKNTTPRLQPLDAGIIASIKERFKRNQVQRACDLLEIGYIEKLYESDVRVAMQTVYNIWHSFEAGIIKKCWSKTGLSEPLRLSCVFHQSSSVYYTPRQLLAFLSN